MKHAQLSMSDIHDAMSAAVGRLIAATRHARDLRVRLLAADAPWTAQCIDQQARETVAGLRAALADAQKEERLAQTALDDARQLHLRTYLADFQNESDAVFRMTRELAKYARDDQPDDLVLKLAKARDHLRGTHAFLGKWIH